MTSSSSTSSADPSLPTNAATLPIYVPLLLLTTIPILILLPPRKLDLYTFALGGTWLASAQYVHTQRETFMTPERLKLPGNEHSIDGRDQVGQTPPQEGNIGQELQRLQELRAERKREKDIGGEIMQRIWDVWAGQDGGAERRGGDESVGRPERPPR